MELTKEQKERLSDYIESSKLTNMKSLRHEMHVTDIYTLKYERLFDEIQKIFYFLKEEFEIEIPDLHIWYSELWCEECEDFDCEKCQEMREDNEEEQKIDIDANNYKIEKWMTDLEEALELESNSICPTGIARKRAMGLL